MLKNFLFFSLCSENFKGVNLKDNLPVPIMDFTVAVAVCKRVVFVTFREEATTKTEYMKAHKDFINMTEDEVFKAYVPDCLLPYEIRLIGSGMICPRDFKKRDSHGGFVFELSMASVRDYFEIIQEFHRKLTQCENIAIAESKRRQGGIGTIRYFTVHHCTIPTSSERLRTQSNYEILRVLRRRTGPCFVSM